MPITNKNEQERLKFYKKNSILNLAYVISEDEGIYECKASNKAGEIRKKFKLFIKSMS